MHWPRAQPIFGTGGMTLADWGIATGVAASVLILEEGRKLGFAVLAALPLAVKGNCLSEPLEKLGIEGLFQSCGALSCPG